MVVECVCCSPFPFVTKPGGLHSFVADHLGATFAVVQVVGDANHASRARVVGGSGLDGPRAAKAAEDLDGGDRSCDGVHALSVGRRRGGEVGVGGGRGAVVDLGRS